MTGEWWRDALTIALVFAAAVLCLAAGVGLLRFSDVLARLHAATKPQVLGVILVVADVIFSTPTIGTITLGFSIILFQALTAPISAHMVGRAAYRTGKFRSDVLFRDELRGRNHLLGLDYPDPEDYVSGNTVATPLVQEAPVEHDPVVPNHEQTPGDTAR
ncbi:monovalent cation/H(+) antiporter subunit G [Mycetocola lacteus]|uniref:Monovalent cation/H(+) antiporter subunit G n=1 Tax=Mycetocola lacteus TaxID=76637 RepID=A0A3L7ATG1_9MICO|nr:MULTISPECIES: monovalent cation/H(+) antiporter subunit G [Mycetocola]MCS4277802.1 multicomponent Na+:H+ antiporter subunit G [Mycetocola sp. BIGb0189]RLP83757.1 monovalent cation/H(+) antiporter subunit G [Mycetocola lacteus]